MADIEQMFHSFFVSPSNRDFLRFLWFRNNDINDEIISYRMCVHTFGNASSPAVATFGLRKTADEEEARFGADVKSFIDRNFYVDDALKSVSTSTQGIDLLKRAQQMLSTANLRLHKIASNNPDVMEAFPHQDRASDLRDLDLCHDIVPTQRSLGVFWDLSNDIFTFKVKIEDKPFTRRGVLSVVNGIFDPLGFAAPVTIKGKMLLRTMSSSHPLLGWDDPLPTEHYSAWAAWHESLLGLGTLCIPRCFTSVPADQVVSRSLHVFFLC